MESDLTTMSGSGSKRSCCINKFREIDGPLIDLRSPKEFEKGHWPGSINLPLFNNKEREYIGKTYKKEGRNNAILLGLEFTKPRLTLLVKEMKKIKELYKSNYIGNKDIYIRLYCWRGGMRSSSVNWLANLFDLNSVTLEGGYKNYRKWVLTEFSKEWNLRVLGGKTGTGKTDILISLAKKGVSIIDLEGLANHRGSSFGGLGLSNQPSTEHYENKIAEQLNTSKKNFSNCIWLEDESSNLGQCRIPRDLFSQMKVAPLLEIYKTEEERISSLVKIYGVLGKENLKEATKRISRRLGPQRTSEALKAIEESNWPLACRAMLEYYDKCYEHSLEKIKSKDKINLSGKNPEESAEILLKKQLVY